MTQRILIAYASRCGSTMEVAQAIGQDLAGRGYSVGVQRVDQVTSLEGYNAVVVGSAVRFGQWLPEAVKFVEKNQSALNRVSTSFFALHLLNWDQDETSTKARLAYLAPVRKLVSPKTEGFFKGVGDLSKVNFVERLIAKMVKSPEGDFRDWDKIKAWANEIV